MAPMQFGKLIAPAAALIVALNARLFVPFRSPVMGNDPETKRTPPRLAETDVSPIDILGDVPTIHDNSSMHWRSRDDAWYHQTRRDLRAHSRTQVVFSRRCSRTHHLRDGLCNGNGTRC
jgi:hypothetical protein